MMRVRFGASAWLIVIGIHPCQCHTIARAHTQDDEDDEEDDEEGVEEAVSQLLGHVLEQAENFSGVRFYFILFFKMDGWSVCVSMCPHKARPAHPTPLSLLPKHNKIHANNRRAPRTACWPSRAAVTRSSGARPSTPATWRGSPCCESFGGLMFTYIHIYNICVYIMWDGHELGLNLFGLLYRLNIYT